LDSECSGGITSIQDGLIQVVELFGTAVLKNPTRLIAAFSDIAPKLQKEKRLLRIFCDCGGNALLLNAAISNQQERESCCGRIIAQMTSEYFISAEAAELICSCFLSAATSKSKPISTGSHETAVLLQQDTRALISAGLSPTDDPMLYAALIKQAKDDPRRDKIEETYLLFEQRDKCLGYGEPLPQHIFSRLSASSSPLDRYEFATRLLYGYQVRQQRTRGRVILSDLASSGFHFAAFRLAVYLADALNDYEQAISILESAINNGCYRLLATLGMLLDEPNTPEHLRDPNRSLWCTKFGAELGIPMCINNMGYFYAEGGKLDKDPQKAYEYYARAASLGCPRAKLNVALHYRDGLGVARNLKMAMHYRYSAFLDDPASEAAGFIDFIRRSDFPRERMIERSSFLVGTKKWRSPDLDFLASVSDNTVMQILVSSAIAAKHGSTLCAIYFMMAVLVLLKKLPIISLNQEQLTHLIEQIIVPHIDRPGVKKATVDKLKKSLSVYYSIQAEKQSSDSEPADNSHTSSISYTSGDKASAIYEISANSGEDSNFVAILLSFFQRDHELFFLRQMKGKLKYYLDIRIRPADYKPLYEALSSGKDGRIKMTLTQAQDYEDVFELTIPNGDNEVACECIRKNGGHFETRLGGAGCQYIYVRAKPESMDSICKALLTVTQNRATIKKKEKC